MCFSTHRLHHARYGTYHLNSLECLDSTHPGAKEEIMEMGISVRRNIIGIGQAIDSAGEQTYMKDAKTSGESFKTVKKIKQNMLFFFIRRRHMKMKITLMKMQ